MHHHACGGVVASVIISVQQIQRKERVLLEKLFVALPFCARTRGPNFSTVPNLGGAAPVDPRNETTYDCETNTRIQ